MKHLALILVIALPAAVHADTWSWRDPSGVVHYSNVQATVPGHATQIRGRIGYTGGDLPALPATDMSAIRANRAEASRLQTERDIRSKLRSIANYRENVRCRQLNRRLADYPNVQLLPDWLVADRWLQLEGLRRWLDTALLELAQRKAGA